MTDLALLITILALLAYLGVKEYFDRKERKLVMRSLMAKNLQEVISAEITDKQEPDKEIEPDFTPLDQVDDKTWMKANGIKEEEDGR